MSLGRISHYELLEPLGEGGMGLVFKARDSRLDRVVAIKLLRPELASLPEYRKRFADEAKRGAGLNHPAIATCSDFGEAELEPGDLLGGPGASKSAPALFLAMEFVPGRDLQGLIHDDVMPLDRTIDLAIQIADGLAAAHDCGVIHRDLKPANVRITPEGRAKILDFGVARVLPEGDSEHAPTISTMTTEGRLLGTPAYMAPELAAGHRADARSDLFSFGVTLYQWVARRPPFTGATPFEVQASIAHTQPQPMSRYAREVPDELERIVRKLLEKDPARRYASAHDVKNDLHALQRARAGERRWRFDTRAMRWGGAAIALTIVLGLAWKALHATPKIRTLAVMPFENRSDEPRLEFLGGAIAKDLVGDLVHDAGLDVATLSATMAGMTASRGSRSLGRDLGVETLLSGALVRAGDGFEARVQLADAASGRVDWSGRYAFTEDGARELERQIAADVGRRLTGRAPASAARSNAGTPAAASASAYFLYQKAAAIMLDPNDPHGPDRALLLLAAATESDPDLPIAWAERSAALWRIWKRDRTAETLREAQEAADRALRLDPALLEARVARAQIYRSTGLYARAIAELTTVLDANPPWDEALVQLAASYRDAGRLDSAETTFRRAVAARPAYWRNWDSLGGLLVQRGKYTESIEAFSQVIRLAPANNRGYEQVAAVQLYRADYDAAIATYRQLPDSVGDGTLASNMGTAFFFARQLPEAGRYDRLAVALEPRNPTWRENLGDYFARAGQPDSARFAYTQAASMYEDAIHLNPESVTLRLSWAAVLAKAGDCPAARSACASVAARVPRDDADAAHLVAKFEALCGSRATAIEAASRAVRLGISPRLLRAEDEFARLIADPGFPQAPARR